MGPRARAGLAVVGRTGGDVGHINEGKLDRVVGRLCKDTRQYIQLGSWITLGCICPYASIPYTGALVKDRLV